MLKLGRMKPLAAAAGRHVHLCDSLHALPAEKDLVVIRVPRHLAGRVEKVKQTRSKAHICCSKAGKLLIQSKNPQLNQSAGFVLGKFEQPVLSSKGWKHQKSFGDFFTINSTKDAAPCMMEAQAASKDLQQAATFKDLQQAATFKDLQQAATFKDLQQAASKDLQQAATFKDLQQAATFKDLQQAATFKDLQQASTFKDLQQAASKDLQQAATFKDLHVCKQLGDTLEDMGVSRPTTVQLQTIPKVMQGHNVLCAAETGSGKTLSYLLPVVQRLQADRTAEGSNSVRALVLVPSRELAEQIAAVCRTLCAPFGLHTKTVGGGQGVGHIKQVFQDHADVLVATPGALLKALQRNYVDLSALSFLVVDEADTMLDPSFSPMLQDVLLNVNIANHPKETRGLDRKAQLLLVGATFPGDVGEVLGQVTDLGRIVTVKSRMLHHIMPHVQQRFLKVKSSDKILELHQALKELPLRGGGAAVVFCNKSSTVNWLGYALDEMGVQHARLQGGIPALVRAGIFQSFQNSETNVLVCTDIASRGLDTSRVRLIVNYDFPESHTDYIHRAGRVGRAGGVGHGEVLSFVTHPWDVEQVQSLETAARRRTTLPGMKSEIQVPKPQTVESDE